MKNKNPFDETVFVHNHGHNLVHEERTHKDIDVSKATMMHRNKKWVCYF